MSELRKDPIVDRWVIIAKNRAERPLELTEGAAARTTAVECPFCEGREGETTAEVFALRAEGTSANQPGWRVRVVTNKYPALLPDAGAFSPSAELLAHPLLPSQPALGAHEVVIESPRHLVGTGDLTEEELTEVLLVYGERLRALRALHRYVQPIVFKNVGAAAGASIEHAHSQIMALPLVPREIAAELAAASRYHRANRQCIYCQLVSDELSSGQRLVIPAANSGGARFVALSAYAARCPFETWVLPAEHQSDFETLSTADARELAAVVRAVATKTDAALDRPAYNYIIHTSPFDTFENDHYHWHIEIIPRVTKTAGFEWGTGLAINPVPPEEAAAIMRALHLAG
jgi:UDPglucose--hexose-1-phosphate uridylyltransferase